MSEEKDHGLYLGDWNAPTYSDQMLRYACLDSFYLRACFLDLEEAMITRVTRFEMNDDFYTINMLDDFRSNMDRLDENSCIQRNSWAWWGTVSRPGGTAWYESKWRQYLSGRTGSR